MSWTRCSTCSTAAVARHRRQDRPEPSRSMTARRPRWSYRELDRRSRIAAWRLRALGLEPGDRLLTWSPSTPELPGSLFRRDARPPRPRPARPAHVGRRDRGHRPRLGRAPPHPRRRPRRPGSARSRPRPLPDDRARRDRRRARRHVPRRLGGPARRLGSARHRRGLRARLHLRHDRQAEGRDARPRQRGRLGRVVPSPDPADGPPDRLAAAAVAPARAVGRAVLRALGRGGHPVCPEPQPAGHLRCAARPPGHLDGRRPPGPRPVLERDRARGRQARPRDRLRAPARRSPGGCRSAGGRACSAASTSSWAATSGCSCRPGPSCHRRSSRAGRTSA